MTVMPKETDLWHSKTPPGVDLSPGQGRSAASRRAHPRVDDRWHDAAGGWGLNVLAEWSHGARKRGSEAPAVRHRAFGLFASAAFGSTMATCSGELLSTVRDREVLPPGTASLLVALDGVMMRMKAETVSETATDAG
ncbi:MAG: hypothetical protein OXE94_10020 [Aestuariivita sp.]|nr:hypothetical protein [Aestuariivita sp.]MCY4203412.1 hypothetical protein [Aestuariivita sp.]MCY4288340.1 hypothetical protein [Aestuariivita sp.]